jgi:hypothetical protein
MTEVPRYCIPVVKADSEEIDSAAHHHEEELIMRTGIRIASSLLLAILFAAGIGPSLQQNTKQPRDLSQASTSWVAVAFPTAQASFARQAARGG